MQLWQEILIVLIPKARRYVSQVIFKSLTDEISGKIRVESNLKIL